MKRGAGDITKFKVTGAVFLLVVAAVTPVATAQDTVAPLGQAPGAPAGSYTLNDFERMNLFSGNMSVAVPLVAVGGRGEASYTAHLTIERRWGLSAREAGFGNIVYTPRFDWFHQGEPGYGPGTVACYYDYQQAQGDFQYGVQRVTYSGADGTQVEFRDRVLNGLPRESNVFSRPNRGREWVSYDGSAATVVFGADVYDGSPACGPWSLRWRDGRRFDGTTLSDRNGNRLSFSYNGQTTQATDSLGRVTTFSRQVGVRDTITFTGSFGVTRTILVDYADLSTVLTAGAVESYVQLFPNINWERPNDVMNPKVVSSLTLPNGRQYTFRYNKFGELTRLTLPTGGRLEITSPSARTSQRASPGPASPAMAPRPASSRSSPARNETSKRAWTTSALGTTPGHRVGLRASIHC